MNEIYLVDLIIDVSIDTDISKFKKYMIKKAIIF